MPVNAGDGGLARRRRSPLEPSDVEALVTAVAAGTPRAVGRAISVVENGGDVAAQLVGALEVPAGETQVVGVTGPPGVGKSTTVCALVAEYRSRGRRVAVLAIDPSSPFNRGALLGDRIRMREHALDPDVFIRSMSTRGHLGGLAAAAPQALRVFETAGFDVVLLETVGVGQSEVEVAELADTTVLILAPHMGDDVQAAKAGIMEIGDIFAVNKADLAGVDRTVRNLTHALYLERKSAGGASDWARPVVRLVASKGDVQELVDAVDEHWGWLQIDDELARRRVHRLTAELEAAVVARVREVLRRLEPGSGPDDVAARVERGDLDYTHAVNDLYAQLMSDRPDAALSSRRF